MNKGDFMEKGSRGGPGVAFESILGVILGVCWTHFWWVWEAFLEYLLMDLGTKLRVMFYIFCALVSRIIEHIWYYMLNTLQEYLVKYRGAQKPCSNIGKYWGAQKPVWKQVDIEVHRKPAGIWVNLEVHSNSWWLREVTQESRARREVCGMTWCRPDFHEKCCRPLEAQ